MKSRNEKKHNKWRRNSDEILSFFLYNIRHKAIHCKKMQLRTKNETNLFQKEGGDEQNEKKANHGVSDNVEY